MFCGSAVEEWDHVFSDKLECVGGLRDEVSSRLFGVVVRSVGGVVSMECFVVPDE